ncbi:MFS transporter [Dyella psychrodurans]|uniref:Lysosomal dipeptide transporter MFSD1 n=1 Tax=Dyella psychrodurans TaxID=1927960 RepID=A0A370X718_9GAMM|nr:MFS transporter [Dyella psychrodurans]RDS84229.1 MFS transporter [Dyella psychrodurans]
MSVKAAVVQSPRKLETAYAMAWGFAAIFYFLEYASRSAPAVMIPELSQAFGVSALGVSAILGSYYYTYSTTSLVAGVLLDRFGARYVVPAGMAVLALGCLLFAIPQSFMGNVGRLAQGAGSAFAFTGAVYLASHGFSAKKLATAIGFTQCFGMLGGSMGQIAVGPLIHGMVGIGQFWVGMGVVVLLVAVGLLLMTPSEKHAAATGEKRNFLTPYKVVLSNPQSYLCGIVSGLLFAPTTIGDMVWGVRMFQVDRLFSYHDAVFAISMVPFGWVFGCPLFGWLADTLHRRKLALIIGVSAMLVCALQLTFLPTAVPSWVTLLVFGIASGSAMIPYTIIKEVNPDNVKGSATGAINFITFSVTALLGPVFSNRFGKTLGLSVTNPEFHFFQSGLFWVAVIALALLVSFALRETGRQPETAR